MKLNLKTFSLSEMYLTNFFFFFFIHKDKGSKIVKAFTKNKQIQDKWKYDKNTHTKKNEYLSDYTYQILTHIVFVIRKVNNCREKINI